MNLLRNLFDYERKETLGDLVFFRVFELFVVLYTVKLAWGWGQYILRISDVVLPLGIAQYVDVSFMFGNSLPLLNAVLITGLLLLGLLRLGRFSYAAAFLLLHLQYAARFTLGEIPHSSNMLGMTLLGLSLAMLFFRDGTYQRRFTLGFAYFFVGLGYTLAAFCKFVGTGLFWSDGRHLWMWIHEKGIDAFAKHGVLEWNWMQEAALSHHGIATAFLTVGLVSELFAFLMWWRPLRTPVVMAVIGLHLGIFLVMNIMFEASLYELILLGFPWAAWIDRLLGYGAMQHLLTRLERLRVRYA